MDNPLKEIPSNKGIPVIKEPVATPFKINSTIKASSSPKQKPVILTPRSLHPCALRFEVSWYPRYEPYYPVDWEQYKHQQLRKGWDIGQTSDSPYKSTIEDSLNRLADISTQQQLQDILPFPEPEIFSGDLLTFL